MPRKPEAKAKMPRQKIVIIYHGDCADGFGGAWAAWKKFGEKAAYLPARDRFALPAPLKGKEVYLIDYTYQDERLMKKLIRENARVTAIDHHITAEKNVKMTKDHLFSLTRSGAALAWEYFHPKKKVPALLRYVEDRDLWNWKIKGSRELLAYLDLFEQKFPIWNRLAKEMEDPKKRAEYLEKGKLLERYDRKLCGELLEGAELVRFEGRKVYAVNASHKYASALGAELAKRTGSFAMIWREVNGRVRVSLRSIRGSGTDVARIAGKYGGGGHKTAAAFAFPAEKKIPWKVLKNEK